MNPTLIRMKGNKAIDGEFSGLYKLTFQSMVGSWSDADVLQTFTARLAGLKKSKIQDDSHHFSHSSGPTFSGIRSEAVGCSGGIGAYVILISLLRAKFMKR